MASYRKTMDRRRWGRRLEVMMISIGLGSCAAEKSVLISPVPGGAHPFVTRSPDRVQVKVDASSVKIPLVVSGAHTRYVDLDVALETALVQALATGANDLPARSPQDYRLLVELIEARAEYSEGRLLVQLSVRATLKQNQGNDYVAQTHAHVRQTGLLGTDDGLSVVLDAVGTVVSQLRGWFFDWTTAH
jgi:hypothetical protein